MYQPQVVTSGGINTAVQSNGRAAPLWYGEVQALTNPSDIDLSLKESGLTYKYALKPLYGDDGLDSWSEPIERAQKLITVAADGRRSASKDVMYKDHEKRKQWNTANPYGQQKDLIRRYGKDNFLNIVGKNYQLHQPEQVYEAYLELAEHMGLQIHMAGVINNGMSVWARVKLDADVIVKDARIERYITILTGVSKSTKAGESPQDVACFNQWNMLLNKTEWYLGNVTHNYMFNPKSFAESIFDKLNPEKVQQELDFLVNSECKQNQKREYFKNVLFVDFSNEKKVEKNTQKLDRYIEIASKSPCKIDLVARNRTWYGAFMDATWLADRFKTSDRVSSNFGGNIGRVKANAYSTALRLAA